MRDGQASDDISDYPVQVQSLSGLTVPFLSPPCFLCSHFPWPPRFDRSSHSRLRYRCFTVSAACSTHNLPCCDGGPRTLQGQLLPLEIRALKGGRCHILCPFRDCNYGTYLAYWQVSSLDGDPLRVWRFQ